MSNFEPRFEDILKELMPLPVNDFADEVMHRVEVYRGTEKQDDKTLVVLESAHATSGTTPA